VAPVVVADASVLIALNQIDQLSLLQKLFTEVLVPPAVAREAAPSLPQLPVWIHTRALEGPPHTAVAKASLDPGETEAISLALEARADRIILDDRQARNLAIALGLVIVGTAGVLFAAKQRGLITAVRPCLDALRAKGFRLRKEVYEEVLQAAGESEGDG
jgi:predicted nucleic acid-binding protein